MKKSTVKSTMIVLMLLVVALYFIAGTYARYTTAFTGTSTVNVAKWAVALAAGSQATENTFAVTLTTTDGDEDYVVPEKIAPSITASGDIQIDLTGTEVAVDISAALDETASEYATFTTAIGTSKIAPTIKVTAADDLASCVVDNQDGTYTVKLKDGAKFDGTSAVVTVTVNVYWDNDHDDHNASDTSIGEDVTSLTVPMKVTVQQHIED